MARTIVVIGGNLFRLAAQYLGDATQWIRIAELNGFTDPVLDGQVTVTLPDVNSTATGGVPDQP